MEVVLLNLSTLRTNLQAFLFFCSLFCLGLCAVFCPASEAVFALRDDRGAEIRLKAPASRIVSLYAGHTENLVAVGAGGNLAAVSSTDDRDITGDLPRLPLRPGVEQIAALRPDLVLVRSMQASAQSPLFDKLESLGVAVFVLDPPSWGEFVPYLKLLGRLTGHEEGARIAATGAAKLMSAETNPSPVGVFLVAQGRTLSTCGPDSWAAHVVALAGGRNVASGARPMSPGSVIAPFGAERLLSADGEVEAILLQQGAMNGTTAREFAADPRFTGMRAVRAGRVYDISEADISRPSLLRLEAGVTRLRKLFAR